MSHNRYSLQKEKKKYKAEIKGTLDGFRVTPKNEVPYEGVTVQRMTVMNPSFIEKVIKKKIKRKLDSYMQYIIKILESDNDDETGIDVALNDLERLKATIKHKYRIYLDKKYVELLMQKIRLLERELKIKKYYIENYEFELEEEKGKSK